MVFNKLYYTLIAETGKLSSTTNIYRKVQNTNHNK